MQKTVGPIEAKITTTMTRRARMAIWGFKLAAYFGIPFDTARAARMIVGLMRIEVR